MTRGVYTTLLYNPPKIASSHGFGHDKMSMMATTPAMLAQDAHILLRLCLQWQRSLRLVLLSLYLKWSRRWATWQLGHERLRNCPAVLDISCPFTTK